MRNDIHRPSAIIPADYDFVAFREAEGGPLALAGHAHALMTIRQHMDRTGGKWSGHEHGGSCDVCGNVHARSHAIFYHPKTNTYIKTGADCADKIDDGVADAFRTFRKTVADARKRKAGQEKAKLMLADWDLTEAWDLYSRDATEGFTKGQHIIRDVVRKLISYGHLSDKQLDLIRRLLAQQEEDAQRQAQREAEAEAAQPIPAMDGRRKVEGEVVSLQWRENRFGMQLKMLVKHADGWKVWGSAPSAIADVKRGQMVRFVAAVQASDDDPKFGFFSRPAQAEIMA